MNIAVDKRSSPYYALRDRQGNAIGVTACDIDGDGREEIYFLNTNNAFSGTGVGPRASSCSPPSSPRTTWGRALGTRAALDIVPRCLQGLALSPQESPFSSCACSWPSSPGGWAWRWRALSQSPVLTFRCCPLASL